MKVYIYYVSSGVWLRWRSEWACFSAARAQEKHRGGVPAPCGELARVPARGSSVRGPWGGTLSLGGAPLDGPGREAVAPARRMRLAAVAGSGMDRRPVVGAGRASACGG
ncbi:hypothetical protein NDU88_003897 [Pleurodeles waltl]|uniref:Uncharacterized protein n=1 Tax=Pleurodeles waltl TaxID=8319 RepID=A0AAV7W6Q2_PLEWA|nr:hypothetical protein NDU88_003897 [Pleurodeles waltl]